MSGIRFQIHTVPVDDGEIERYGIIVAELSSHERHYAGAALMNIMGMASELNELMHSSNIDLALLQSSEIQRDGERQIHVNEQRYDTLPEQAPLSSCTICTETYKDVDVVSLLGCHHLFHSECIREWSRYNPSCPLCRTKIPTSTAASS